MAFFGLKTYFKKFFLGYFCPPIKVMWKNRAKRASKWVFIGGGFKSPPPNRCQFQRPLMVGLKIHIFRYYNIFISIRKFNGTLYVSWLKGKYDVHLLSILGHEWIKNFFIQIIFRVGFIYFWIFEVQNIFLSKKGANCTWEEISTPPIGCV